MQHLDSADGGFVPGEPLRLLCRRRMRFVGTLHGGANVEVLEMLERIHQGGLTPEECIRLAKDKTNPFRLYGFGHRVYKNYDPRAKILKQASEKVFASLKRHDPLLDIARKLEELALNDPYFIERRLYPNVDFYSGILLRAMGIPTNMFTVLFAIGRLPGWIAQWKEQHDDPTAKILRPRQIYVGPPRDKLRTYGAAGLSPRKPAIAWAGGATLATCLTGRTAEHTAPGHPIPNRPTGHRWPSPAGPLKWPFTKASLPR